MSQVRRVTGIGAVTPVGNNAPSTWAALLGGCSGVAPVTLFDPSPFGSAIAGEVKDFRPEDVLPAREARRMDRYSQLGCVAALEALADAGLAGRGPLGAEAGVVFGSGNGGMALAAEQQHVYDNGGPRRVSPFFIPGSLINLASGLISIEFGLKGPNHSVVTACSTGSHAIGDAARLVALDDADIMVAGGAESSICRLVIAGFIACKALSTHFNDLHYAFVTGPNTHAMRNELLTCSEQG